MTDRRLKRRGVDSVVKITDYKHSDWGTIGWRRLVVNDPMPEAAQRCIGPSQTPSCQCNAGRAAFSFLESKK